MLFVSSDLAV